MNSKIKTTLFFLLYVALSVFLINGVYISGVLSQKKFIHPEISYRYKKASENLIKLENQQYAYNNVYNEALNHKDIETLDYVEDILEPYYHETMMTQTFLTMLERLDSRMKKESLFNYWVDVFSKGDKPQWIYNVEEDSVCKNGFYYGLGFEYSPLTNEVKKVSENSPVKNLDLEGRILVGFFYKNKLYTNLDRIRGNKKVDLKIIYTSTNGLQYKNVKTKKICFND